MTDGKTIPGLFPIIKRPERQPRNPWETASSEELKKAEDLEAVLDVNEDLAECMEDGCREKRCVIPGEGESVLCRFHTQEVLACRAKAPPLRRGFDYQSAGRKTFLVEDLSFLDAEENRSTLEGHMDFVKVAGELSESEAEKDEKARKAFAKKVQSRMIEPLCKEFDIAFIIHPSYDEATFLSKETRPNERHFEGIWYRPAWGGATDTVDNTQDKKMAQAIRACWDVLRKHRLISSRDVRVQSCENGLDPSLKEKVIYRLGYLASCP